MEASKGSPAWAGPPGVIPGAAIARPKAKRKQQNERAMDVAVMRPLLNADSPSLARSCYLRLNHKQTPQMSDIPSEILGIAEGVRAWVRCSIDAKETHKSHGSIASLGGLMFLGSVGRLSPKGPQTPLSRRESCQVRRHLASPLPFLGSQSIGRSKTNYSQILILISCDVTLSILRTQ
jgi:hypothetical protein